MEDEEGVGVVVGVEGGIIARVDCIIGSTSDTGQVAMFE